MTTSPDRSRTWHVLCSPARMHVPPQLQLFQILAELGVFDAISAVTALVVLLWPPVRVVLMIGLVIRQWWVDR